MHGIYNIFVRLTELLFRLAWSTRLVNCFSKESKTWKYVTGQHGLLESIRQTMQAGTKELIWIHVASNGEYAVARPVIKALADTGRQVVLTVFSPSGYEVLKHADRQDSGADYVFYLPWDTPQNVVEFLDIVKPAKAIFVISEYWINYLSELYRRQIPTYTLSTLVRRDSYLLKWYGCPIRKALRAVTTFMVLNVDTAANLRRIGFTNVKVVGDPLFDNAVGIAHQPYHNAVIERFCQTAANGVFVAGSISDERDSRLVCSLSNVYPNLKCIFVPHEISEQKLNAIVYEAEGCAKLYSDCSADTDFSKTQILIIDYIGELARIYRYGQWAYVGGGFTPYLHSVIEPVVYGIPVAFGPRVERKITPQQLIDIGVGTIVASRSDIKRWFDGLNDEARLSEAKHAAAQYVAGNSNATGKIIQVILG